MKKIIFFTFCHISLLQTTIAATLPTPPDVYGNIATYHTLDAITAAKDSASCPSDTIALSGNLRPCTSHAYQGACFLFAPANTKFDDTTGKFQFSNDICVYK